MSKSGKKLLYKNRNYDIIRNRELGLKRKLGYEDDICKKIYSNFDKYQADIPLQRHTNNQGAIFNLEFSLDGNLLVAACEEESVLIFDANNQKFISKIENAHDRCVNCVKFLCPNTFATCSDDGTIKLWDTRFLKTSTRTLNGHSNWVKNIEYSEQEKVMVTSAFDGSIYAWDLSSPTENNVLFDKVFVMSGLMRTKLTPDGTKMVIATTSGYLIVVHDLNLRYMYNDMKTFRPNLYRLMQLSEQTFPAATMYNYLFCQTRKRNRIEFIDDFPNDSEVISSVQIHPMGWSALSRNVSSDDSEEWTCVHDIQTRDPKDYEDAFSIEEAALPADCQEDEEEEEPTDRRPTDIWMGFMTNSQYLTERNSFIRSENTSDRSYMGVINSGLIGRNPYSRFFKQPSDRYKIITNLPRCTHYKEELSVGKGYIKELCFSTDGRLVCSPYDKGVRLLSFNKELQEMCYCLPLPKTPNELYTVATMKDYHPQVVVCCKFNPKHYQMVSGCLGGEIVWYKPIL